MFQFGSSSCCRFCLFGTTANLLSTIWRVYSSFTTRRPSERWRKVRTEAGQTFQSFILKSHNFWLYICLIENVPYEKFNFFRTTDHTQSSSSYLLVYITRIDFSTILCFILWPEWLYGSFNFIFGRREFRKPTILGVHSGIWWIT